MKFQSTGITSIILALSLVLTTPLSIGAYGIVETKVSGAAREVIQDGSQNKDSPQFVMILYVPRHTYKSSSADGNQRRLFFKDRNPT